MDRKVLLEIKDVSAAYGRKQVLRDISFDLQPHALTCLMGKNGSGKTTLLKCLVNQIAHTGGTFLNGEELENLSIRALARKISYIPQRTGITISLPVIDVVLMGYNPILKLLEHPSKAQKEKALEALAQVGMKGHEEEDFQTLSEGQKQLVLLARTLIEHTNLLLLDEPDSALDFQNRYMILKRLRKMVAEEDKAGLLCLHDPMLAMEMCDQLVLIKDGMCVDIIRPQEDEMETMERALRKIYDNILLAECIDNKGKRHFTLLWEEEV